MMFMFFYKKTAPLVTRFEIFDFFTRFSLVKFSPKLLVLFYLPKIHVYRIRDLEIFNWYNYSAILSSLKVIDPETKIAE